VAAEGFGVHLLVAEEDFVHLIEVALHDADAGE
jgi:hypothetical protein